MLQPYRQAQQILRRTRMGAFDRGAVFDQRLAAAERGRIGEDFHFRGQRQRGLAAAAQFDAHHPAEIAHLLRGHGVARVRRQARIVHAFDLLLRGQKIPDRARIRAVHRHARAQRAAAAQDQPGAERGQGGTGDVQAMRGFGEQHVAFREHQRTAQHIAVAAEVLGGRMHRDIGAQGQRALQQRGGEGVVDHRQCAGGMRDLHQRSDVADLHARIGRRFDPDQRRLQRAGGADRVQVAHVDRHRLDAALGQILGAEHPQAGVAVVGNQQPRPVGQTFQQGADRRHAGGERQCILASFQRRQRLAQAVVGRVALALVLVAGDAFARRAVAEGGGEVDRRRHGAGGGVGRIAAMHGKGFGAHWIHSWSGRQCPHLRQCQASDSWSSRPHCPQRTVRRWPRIVDASSAV